MKLSQKDLDNMARTAADKLICTAGLRNAKKISAKVRKILLAEDKRRKLGGQ